MMHATRVVEEGILPGAWHCCAMKCQELRRTTTTRKPASRSSAPWPARQIAPTPARTVVVARPNQYGFGFDAQSGEYVNMMSKGIIDPAKVVRAALQGAASVAGLLITTEAMVAELPSKNGMPPGVSAGGGMGF